MTLFEELKRRKVFRVAGTYAVVAWILMQIGEVTFPALNIPNWVMSTLVVILLGGFPIAIIFAWIFDKTPQGYIKTDVKETEELSGKSVNVDSRPFYKQKRNILLTVGVVGGVLLGLFGGNKFSSTSIETTKDITKMAILPFTNIKQDKDNDFLGFALSDEIINRLGYLKSIIVRPSGSVRKYQGTKEDLNQVGNDLDVELILTGSYIREGNQLRLSTELIDINKNERLWNKTVRVDYSDIFEIQETVSRDIVESLKYNLEPDETNNLSLNKSVDAAAYELFLKAKNYPTNRVSDLITGIDLCDKSIEIDPNYAPTWAQKGSFGHLLSQASSNARYYRKLSIDAFDKALKLDPNSLYVIRLANNFYSELGKVEESTEMAIKSLQFGLTTEVLENVAYNCRYAGLLDHSIDIYQMAENISQMYISSQSSPLIQMGKAMIYKGDYLAAKDMINRGINVYAEKGRTDPVAIVYEGMPYLYLNDIENAKRVFNRVYEIDPENSWSIIGKTYIELITGQFTSARNRINILEKRQIHDSEMVYRFAHFYSFLGEFDKAIDALEYSVEEGFFCYSYIASDPFTKPIHNNPRFKSILEKAKIRQELYVKRFGAEIKSLIGMPS